MSMEQRLKNLGIPEDATPDEQERLLEKKRAELARKLQENEVLYAVQEKADKP